MTVDGLTSVGSTGSGTGAVSSNPDGIECTVTDGSATGICSATFDANTVVTLTAVAASGSVFMSWVDLASGTDFDYEETLGFHTGVDSSNPLAVDIGNDRDLVVQPDFVEQ